MRLYIGLFVRLPGIILDCCREAICHGDDTGHLSAGGGGGFSSSDLSKSGPTPPPVLTSPALIPLRSPPLIVFQRLRTSLLFFLFCFVLIWHGSFVNSSPLTFCPFSPYLFFSLSLKILERKNSPSQSLLPVLRHSALCSGITPCLQAVLLVFRD